MRKKFLEISMKSIKKKYPTYSKEKLEEIEYGLEALYITFTKTLVIALISVFLGVIKEVFLILIFYNILRTTAFGLHAKTSLQCYLLSGILFIGAGLLCKYVDIIFEVKIGLSLFCLVNIIFFAPSDTYKRPLINKRKRTIYKILSIIISSIYVILIFILKKSIISSYILCGLVDSTLMIHPLIYRVFQLPYNNYKTYNELYN